MERKMQCIMCVFVLSPLFVTTAVSVAAAEKTAAGPTFYLQQLGYPTDTVEQILNATTSKKALARRLALEVLTDRRGKRAIKTLRRFLDDPEIRVRCTAAHLLATLGNNSGLERMQKDFVELAPHNGVPFFEGLDEFTEQEKKKRNETLRNAIRVAKVLAELGDNRGFELTAQMALAGPFAATRTDSVHALIQMARADKAVLLREEIDPVFTLCAIAAAERNYTAFSVLTTQVREQLDASTATRILEHAISNENQNKRAILGAKLHLKLVKEKKNHPQKQQVR